MKKLLNIMIIAVSFNVINILDVHATQSEINPLNPAQQNMNPVISVESVRRGLTLDQQVEMFYQEAIGGFDPKEVKKLEKISTFCTACTWILGAVPAISPIFAFFSDSSSMKIASSVVTMGSAAASTVFGIVEKYLDSAISTKKKVLICIKNPDDPVPLQEDTINLQHQNQITNYTVNSILKEVEKK